MAEYLLTRSLTLERPLPQVFDFFSDAGNLERITPPEIGFRIISPRPIEIRQGTLIDYKLNLYGLSINWQTEISEWDPPNYFVDRQVSGPYGQWIHRHTFTGLSEDKTLIEDEVRYRMPLEPLGDIVQFFVKRELEYIFDFRQKAVAEILEVR